MAPLPVYRVPRRFITAPVEPPPYGLVALSFTGHLLFLFGALLLSSFMSIRIDQSKIYIVNLVPASPALGTPAPAAPAKPATPPAPALPRVEERTPPRPPRVETPPPKAETPPPKLETPPPIAQPAPPARPVEPVAPPRTPELAPPRATVSRPPELALPRRAERETPPLDVPGTRDRVVDRVPTPPPLTPPPIAQPAPRVPEPPRVAVPPQAPSVPPATVATARPGPEPGQPGRPDPTLPRTPGNISLDVSDFPFTYYLRQIHAKINERWVPPRAGSARSERTVVLFEIQRDGQIREPLLERRSGNEIYDQSALRAVMEASPFPPLPPEFKGPFLRVHFGFDLEMQQG